MPEERKTKPKGGGRKGFLLRLPPELLEELRGWASNDLRSLNAHIEYLLRDAVRRRRGKPEDPEDPDEAGVEG